MKHYVRTKYGDSQIIMEEINGLRNLMGVVKAMGIDPPYGLASVVHC